MRILVTGCEGFIGGEIFKRLVKQENYVVGYDIANHGGDYDIGEVYKIIKANNLDAVIHCGAISSTAEKNYDKVMHFNYDFTRDLIDICHEFGVLLQISSSASVYGNQLRRPFKEDDPLNPQSLYAFSKCLCERYAMKKIYEEGAFIQIFRYFNVFSYEGLENHKGSQSSPHHKFIKLIKENKEVEFFKHKDLSDLNRRDFIHVNSLTSTQLKFLKIEEDGIWNIGSGKTSTFENVFSNCIKYALRKDAHFLDPRDLEDFTYSYPQSYIDIPENIKDQYQSYTCADLTKLNKTLGIK